MAENISQSLGKGLSPAQFMAQMTKNQTGFQHRYQTFTWANVGHQSFFEDLDGRGLTCVIIAADWCGDVVRNVPVILRLMETSRIPTQILVMEDHLETMDKFLTMGGRSIPVVLFVRDNGDVVGRWGPRPAYIQEPMVSFKASHHDKEDPKYHEDLQETRKEIVRRYGEGTSYHELIVDEIRAILVDL